MQLSLKRNFTMMSRNFNWWLIRKESSGFDKYGIPMNNIYYNGYFLCKSRIHHVFQPEEEGYNQQTNIIQEPEGYWNDKTYEKYREKFSKFVQEAIVFWAD